MSESNICEICGGEKSIAYLLETLPTATIPVAANLPYKACMGHPKGAPKHDGKLDEKGDYRVDFSPKSKAGTYVRILGYDDGAVLTPAQAISLLSWLEQNRPELTALAEAMDKHE